MYIYQFISAYTVLYCLMWFLYVRVEQPSDATTEIDSDATSTGGDDARVDKANRRAATRGHLIGRSQTEDLADVRVRARADGPRRKGSFATRDFVQLAPGCNLAESSSAILYFHDVFNFMLVCFCDSPCLMFLLISK